MQVNQQAAEPGNKQSKRWDPSGCGQNLGTPLAVPIVGVHPTSLGWHVLWYWGVTCRDVCSWLSKASSWRQRKAIEGFGQRRDKVDLGYSKITGGRICCREEGGLKWEGCRGDESSEKWRSPPSVGGAGRLRQKWRGDEDKTRSHIIGSIVLSDQTNKQINKQIAWLEAILLGFKHQLGILLNLCVPQFPYL